MALGNLKPFLPLKSVIYIKSKKEKTKQSSSLFALAKPQDLQTADLQRDDEDEDDGEVSQPIFGICQKSEG